MPLQMIGAVKPPTCFGSKGPVMGIEHIDMARRLESRLAVSRREIWADPPPRTFGELYSNLRRLPQLASVPDELLWEAIIQSLRGTVHPLIPHIDENTEIDDILSGL